MRTPRLFPRISIRRTPSLIFVGCLLSLTAAIATETAQDSRPERTPVSPARFRFETVNGQSLGLWEGERPILVFNHGEVTSPNAPNARSHSNYFHPIYGLDGEVLTDDFPKDHVYHRGLYWAWSHIRIAGQEHDFWSLRGIRYQFQRWLAREVSESKAILGVENGWFVGDKQVIHHHSQIDLPDVTHALGPVRGCLGAIQRRQQHSRQQSDDRNDHKQFDQSEPRIGLSHGQSGRF